MWFQYELAREKASRLQAEAMAAQRVAHLTGPRTRRNPIAGLVGRARQWRSPRPGWPSPRPAATASWDAGRTRRRRVAPGAEVAPEVPEILCLRAAGRSVERAA